MFVHTYSPHPTHGPASTDTINLVHRYHDDVSERGHTRSTCRANLCFHPLLPSPQSHTHQLALLFFMFMIHPPGPPPPLPHHTDANTHATWRRPSQGPVQDGPQPHSCSTVAYLAPLRAFMRVAAGLVVVRHVPLLALPLLPRPPPPHPPGHRTT